MRTKDLKLPGLSIIYLLISPSWILTLASPIAYSLLHVAEDTRRCLIFQHLCHSSKEGLWLALVGPISVCQGYLTALRMDRRAAWSEAGRREAMNPELMKWQREWWGGVGSKIRRRQNSESIGHCLKGKGENGSEECMMWPQFPTWSSGGIVILLTGVQEGSSLSWERGNLVYFTSHGYLNLYSEFFQRQ